MMFGPPESGIWDYFSLDLSDQPKESWLLGSQFHWDSEPLISLLQQRYLFGTSEMPPTISLASIALHLMMHLISFLHLISKPFLSKLYSNTMSDKMVDFIILYLLFILNSNSWAPSNFEAPDKCLSECMSLPAISIPGWKWTYTNLFSCAGAKLKKWTSQIGSVLIKLHEWQKKKKKPLFRSWITTV